MIHCTHGHWHHKYTREVAALAHGKGGVLIFGQGPDIPNGYKLPKAVIQKIRADLDLHLGPDFPVQFERVEHQKGLYHLRLEIPSSRDQIWERYGLVWVCFDQKIFKCTQEDLRGLWKALEQGLEPEDESIDLWLQQRSQEQTLFDQGIFQILSTADGSTTLYRKDLDETYHSKHGSRRESAYVFIQAGLEYLNLDKIDLLEIGLGTGLNCLLSAQNPNCPIYYHALEPIPLPPEVLPILRSSFGEDLALDFQNLHQAPWNQEFDLKPGFKVYKDLIKLENFQAPNQSFDLIYFDAFAPNKQPEMWQIEHFDKLFAMLRPGGVLVSYCSQSAFKKALIHAGFEVELLAGPPGKREMIRAQKAKDFS